MQDLFHIPSCFSSGEKLSGDPAPAAAAATKSGQSAMISVYRTKVAGHCRLITVTWCKNLLTHGLSVSVEGSDHCDDKEDKSTINRNQHSCKVEMQPWHFWRKQGSKRLLVEGKPIDLFWDLKSAKFSDGPEPQSDYYVAVVSGGKLALLLGDLKDKACHRTGSHPSTAEAVLVCRKEHVFGKKNFSTRAKFHESGRCHGISVECNNRGISGNMESELVIKIDGSVSIHVRHLQWKFRGNAYIWVDQLRLEVYWDVHDWLFSPGLRHALFVFKPDQSSKPSSTSLLADGDQGSNGNEDLQ